MTLNVRTWLLRLESANLNRMWLALVLGALAVFGFAPFDMPVLTMLSMVGFWWLLATAKDWRQGTREGFIFGLGFFGLGANWLGISLAVYGGVPFGIAWLMVIAFVVMLASFTAFVGAIAVHFRATVAPWLWAMVFVPSVWVFAEWLRIVIWDGFPWLLVAYSHADTWLAGWAPITGSLGVSWAVAFSAGLVWWMAQSGRWIQGALGYALFWALSGQIGEVTWVKPQGDAQSLALVHGQISETVKWDARALPALLDAYSQATKPVIGKVPLVVWPETAIPTFLDSVQERLAPLILSADANKTTIFTGVAMRDDSISGREYFNSIAALDNTLRYDKRHLVPFSEYYPGFAFFAYVSKMMGMPMAQFTAGTGAQVLSLMGQQVAMGVCYEADFVQEMARIDAADWWLIVSDDGWFYPSAMAYQHWQMVKLHARVLGREIVRVTNQGVTGVAKINGEGAVLALPTDALGARMAQVQAYTGQTPYVRWHDMMLLGMLSFVFAFVFMRHRRSLRQESPE